MAYSELTSNKIIDLEATAGTTNINTCFVGNKNTTTGDVTGNVNKKTITFEEINVDWITNINLIDVNDTVKAISVTYGANTSGVIRSCMLKLKGQTSSYGLILKQAVGSTGSTGSHIWYKITTTNLNLARFIEHRSQICPRLILAEESYMSIASSEEQLSQLYGHLANVYNNSRLHTYNADYSTDTTLYFDIYVGANNLLLIITNDGEKQIEPGTSTVGAYIVAINTSQQESNSDLGYIGIGPFWYNNHGGSGEHIPGTEYTSASHYFIASTQLYSTMPNTSDTAYEINCDVLHKNY